MKIDLTKAQIEAIQKLLAAHSEIAGKVPNHNVCWRAYESIEEQTGIEKYTKKDREDSKKRLKDMRWKL